jgi:hypothetical protein
MLIEDKIVFIKTPKNASSSIYESLILNDFNVQEGNPFIHLETKKSIDLWKNENQPLVIDNYHQTYDELNVYFPHKQYKYVGIKRDSTDRFISAWKYMIKLLIDNADIFRNNITQSSDFSKMTTNEVIEFFKPIITKLYSVDNNEVEKVVSEHFCSNATEATYNHWKAIAKTFQSQYYWGIDKCDLIFKFEELNMFEKYITTEFNKDFKLSHSNTTDKVDIKLEKTKELIEFVEKYIDSPFKLKKML